jgi:hypothetical protein
VLADKFVDTYLQDFDEEIDLKKTLKWKNFKKIAKHKKLFDAKKLVEKWMKREKSDIKQKIEARRQQTIKMFKAHQKLIQEMKQIQKNERDAKFIPLLEETIEKNKVLRTINYKDRINKVLETRMNVHWRKLLKSNRESRRRIQLIIKGVNHSKAEIEIEQPEFQEVMGLY